MDKLTILLELAKKLGIKPSKIIGTQGNVVPLKKPSLTNVVVDEFKLKNSINEGDLTMDKIKQEVEETLKLALSKNLNDDELSKAANNAARIDRQLFPPSAEVIAAGSGEKVTGKGLEEIIQKGGLMAPPNTPLGKADFQIKRAKQGVEDIKKEFDLGNLIKGAGKDQLSLNRLHNEGLVRAVTRQILSEDIRAGKIKGLTLDDLGTSREPIDYFRKIYGEDALEQLDSIAPEFNRFYTEKEATDFARSKFKFEPNEARAIGSASYEDVEKAKETKDERSFFERLFNINKDKGKKEAEVLNFTAEGDKRKSVDELIDEYNTNYDRTLLTDEEGGSAISYQEFKDIHKRNEEIAKELERKGVKSTPEPEEVKPEGIVIPFRKKFPKPEPEEKSSGGIIGYATGGKVERQSYFLGGIGNFIANPKVSAPVSSPTNEMSLRDRYLSYLNKPSGSYKASSIKDMISKVGGLFGRIANPVNTNPTGEMSLRDRYLSYLNKNNQPSGIGGIISTITNNLSQPSVVSGSLRDRYLNYLNPPQVASPVYDDNTGNGGDSSGSDGFAKGGRIGYEKGKRVISAIDKLLEDMNKKLSKKQSMETVNPKTGEVTIPKKPIKRAEEPTGVTVMDQEPVARTTQDIEKEIDELSTTPITTLEGKRKYNDLHLEFINSLDPGKRNKNLDYKRKSLDVENRLLLKAEEQGLDFDTFEKLRQGLYGPRKQQTLNFIKTGKVNIEPVKPTTTFEEVQGRFKTAAKAADEVFPNYNDPKTAASELANVMAEQKYGKVFDDLSGDKQHELYSEAYDYITSINKLPKRAPTNVWKKGDAITEENFASTPFAPSQETLDNLEKARKMSSEMSLEQRMNQVLNQYDKSMFIKDEQGMVDVSNPQNIEKMALLLKKDHPEIYNEIFNLGEDLSQKQILDNFDVTGRKPNSKGGIIGLTI